MNSKMQFLIVGALVFLQQAQNFAVTVEFGLTGTVISSVSRGTHPIDISVGDAVSGFILYDDVNVFETFRFEVQIQGETFQSWPGWGTPSISEEQIYQWVQSGSSLGWYATENARLDLNLSAMGGALRLFGETFGYPIPDFYEIEANFTAEVSPQTLLSQNVPEGGSTLVLISIAFAALAGALRNPLPRSNQRGRIHKCAAIARRALKRD